MLIKLVHLNWCILRRMIFILKVVQVRRNTSSECGAISTSAWRLHRKGIVSPVWRIQQNEWRSSKQYSLRSIRHKKHKRVAITRCLNNSTHTETNVGAFTRLTKEFRSDENFNAMFIEREPLCLVHSHLCVIIIITIPPFLFFCLPLFVVSWSVHARSQESVGSLRKMPNYCANESVPGWQESSFVREKEI